MMNYELFRKIIVRRIKEFLPHSFVFFNVQIEPVYKTNRVMDCLTLTPSRNIGNVVCPTVFLNEWYEIFKDCEDIDEILEEISSYIIYYSAVLPQDFDFDFKNRKENIIINVINTEKNREYLKTLPHREFLDLSVIYRMIMNFGDEGYDSVVINNYLAEKMEITEDELFGFAAENTRKLFPIRIITMEEIIGKDFEEEEKQKLRDMDAPFIVTNKSFMQGSSYLAQPCEMERIARMLNSGFYVIPSSVNEFYVIPEEYAVPETLKQLLKESNRMPDGESEILSDNLYYYDIGKWSLEIA